MFRGLEGRRALEQRDGVLERAWNCSEKMAFSSAVKVKYKYFYFMIMTIVKLKRERERRSVSPGPRKKVKEC